MDETCGDAEGKAGGGGGVEEDMEVGECSEEEEDEEEDIDLGSSPITDNSSVIMSMTSPAPTAYEGLASPLRVVPGVISGGKPVGIKRGPGRPRGPGSRGGGAGAVRVKKTSNQPSKFKRWKGLLVSGVYPSSNGKTPGENGEEESTSPVQPSTPVEQKTPIFVDEPLFTEQWPSKVCVLCNLTEHSQLGQGKMCRVECTIEELPKEIPKELLMSPPETPPIDATSPRHQAQLYQNRRQKGMSKFRNAHGSGLEPVDELSLVGHTDAPEPSNIVDAGFIYVHEWCASWCTGITRKHGNTFQNVPFAVMAAANRRCYHCSRYGAGGACIVPSCNKHFHTPCAAAAATFQYTKSMILICSQHIEHVETNSALSDVVCYSCNSLGNVSNLVMCSMCGKHHHGACIGNALQPGLRAGWQCADCRICQLCRQCEDTNRMLVCDSCDKAYHPFCVRPAMSSVPKVGWKCKRCRLCSDCGARTPGGGLSSRWHSNYTVCDSCYQQRNKGFSCPVCHKAYRAAALREMVRCSQCQRFVHGTCDKEADFVSYHRKKEAHPDYEYICLSCKNNSTVHFMKRKDSTDDIQFDSNLSVSQESFMANDDNDGDSEKSDDTSRRFSMVGLGKGKPFYATKIAKKRLGLSTGPGRPKGSGKLPSVTSALSNFQKKHKFSDFGRKRGSKTKIRGMFGVPGLALQSPTWSSSDPAPKSGDDEPGCENKLILCAAKEKFVLGQDVCVMCGALGIDQEACLICCSQCGQCFHPYCVTVKVTKVMLTRGWRCLDCTVCEGCGQRNDEARLILCDDCDISYHIYCMDPPMGSVPTGGWKCKWCAQCLTCGATSPGVNATWQSNFSQCGACASRTTCPACYELYTDGDLIIKCINCDRWLHCLCDTITTEQEAEAYCAQGYTCVMCRPANMPLAPPVTPTRAPSPEFPTEGKANDYYVDGVCLSEVGLQQIKTLNLENSNQPVRRKRPGFKRSQENDSLNLDDGENENPNPVYKDGMVWGSKENGPVPSPPEGFSLSTSESGVVILKRKKQRNLQKLGIGGFSAVKMRSSRFKDDEEGLNTFGEDKPRRKPRCTKKRSKLAESYPSYLQEAFFGRELLDITKESTQELESEESEESDNEKPKVDQDKTISLSQDELKVMADATARKEKEELARNSPCVSVKEEDMSDSENFKDILHLPDNLLHNDLVNTIMNERDVIKSEIDSGTHEPNGDQKDELSEILGPNFSLDSIQTGLPNMDSKDVEEIFKGVLTHESQDAHSTSPLVPRGPTPGTPSQAQVSPQQGLPTTVLSRSGSVTPAVHSNLPSPMGFPSVSPYNSEYSNSPQFSPGGDNSPWGGDDNANNQRNSLKMEQDEALGQHATIAAVLYANMNHPELKQEFPSWPERFKQVIRKWRQLPNEKRAPYVQLAKENRTNVRIKKTQQIGKEEAEEEGSNGKRTASGKTFEVCPPPKLGDRGTPSPATSPTPDQKLVSTASNTSPMHPTPPAQETFPSTIPSHPSTIQYIPLNTSGIRATFHIIPTSIVTTTETSPSTTRTIQYQYERSTIHYPPTNVVIQSVPPLIMTSTPVQQTSDSKNLLQLIPTKTSPVSTVISQPSARSQVQFIQAVKTVQSTTESELKLTNTICSPVSDQHIRVLTPSEIMRTLPSLGQETYDTPPVTEQEKTTMNKTSREAEQERWKQLQALRQQHQLFAQSRPAVPPRLPRQLSNEGPNLVQYSPENPNSQAPPTQQLLVSTPQEPTAATALGGLGSPRPTQFTTPAGIKTVRQAPPGTVYRTVLRPPGPAASPFSPPRQPAPEEMNRQLRDLLKGQHIKQETVIGENSVLATSTPGQIRGQLAQVRAPQPLHQANVQGVMDARVRYHLLQQSRPNFPGSPVRLPAARQQLEQFNAMVQRQQFAQAAPNSSSSAIVRAPQQQQLVVDQSARIQAQLESRLPAANNRDGEEIPDSVTAELEKLEQEGGSIAEAEAMSPILGDFVEDDDDALLAEMGADFNILAYADPELDDITDGDKTNLHIPHLDDLEEEMEKKKQSNANEAKPSEAPQAPNEQKPQLPQPKEETPQPNQIVLPNRTPPTSLPVSVVATNNMAQSPPVTQQGTMVNHVLPAAKDKTFTPFVTPNTPLPRMQLMPGGVTSPRAQQAAPPMPGGQNSEFIQISPPPPYPGPPPPYPGQIQSTIRVGGPKVARSALPPLSAAAPRRSLLLQEQPLLLEDLLEEEKREQEQRSGTPVQGPSSGTSLMSDADFEMLRADVLGTTTQVSSPPQISSVPLLNITVQPAPPLPPDNIVTEQDRQMQIQYEQWLHSNNSAVTQQLKYYETEVQKLRKIRKSLNSRQRQLRKNGNQLPPKDAVELQRVQGETTVLQKHLEAARKQSRTHTIVMQEYQNKQDQKNGGVASSVITANVLVPQGMDSSSPQSPNGMPPGMQQQQTMLPSPQTSASPLHHSPRIGTPHSQSGDDKSDNGLASPRPPPMAPTPPSPHQFHQIRHPGMVPRFARSPEGQPRPRLVLQSAQNSAMYSAPRAFVTSPQSPSLSPQNVIPSRLTPQHQQLLIQRHQLQQQKRELLLRQEALQEGLIPRQLQTQDGVGLISRQLQSQDGVGLIPRQLQTQDGVGLIPRQLQTQDGVGLIPRQLQTQDGVGLIPRQLQTQDGVGLIPRQLQTQDGVQRQVLLRQGLIQDDSLTPQEQQQQLQALQQRQQQLQQNRQQLIMTQQGKVAQYRQLIQQPSTLIQSNQMQSPTNTNQQLISQFASSSPVPPSPMQSPSPISTMSNTPQYSTSSSPLHPPPSPMLSQFQNPSSSPMPQQSPRVQNYQTANSPMTPQSPMVYSGLQTPTSPMPQFNQPNSPMPPHSPRVQQQYGQPPSSPMGSNSQNSMMQQQYVHRPNSPMVPMGSPMPMRRPSSTGGSIASSPAAERPQSVEPRTPQEQDVNNMMGANGGGGGGGNPYLPFNPIPFPPELYRDGYLKMGLKGGSPMWSDKTQPLRKPLLKGKVGQPSPGTSANNDEKSRKSLVSVDYNDFDEESTPPTTPPVKAALIKKSDGPVKTRQSEDTDSELTVYDDIVLVEGCKEGNLEVEELQSALENNVMSTVVSMPMMIDDPDILDDCLVSSSDLVVLDVDNTNNDNDCILGKDDENMLLLDDDISDGLKVDDELMELDEDMPSPPLGRKRISGKVLPGQSIHLEDKKQTPEIPDSPDDSSVDTIKERNEQVTSSGEEKMKAEDKLKNDSNKSQDMNVDRNIPTSVQPNVLVSRSSAAFTPISTQKSIPVCSERNLSKQQAAIASLVQDAVNAAKLAAAEAQNSQKTTLTDTSNANTSHIFSRPMNIVHGGRGPQNQYLSSAVITNKIENQLAGGSELIMKDGKTIKHEPSSPDHSPTKSETRAYQENSIPLEHRNRIMEFLKSDEPTGPCDRDPIKNFGLQNKRTNLILKLEENSEGEGGSKLSLRLDNSIRGIDRNAIQKNSSMIFNIVSDKSDGADKPELKFADRNKQQNMTESPYNSNRGEQVTLPAVSSSILEAQLTSMLRSSASDPPTSSNQKIIYAIVNHNNKEPLQQRENPSPHDEIKVEGLAAHLQRTIKSETEVRMTENDIIRNAKIHQNYKPNLYAQSKMKSDSFIVGGTHYKVYTGTQGENLVVPSEENKTQNHYMNKVIDNNSNNHPQVIVKQEPGLSSYNKPKPTDRFTSNEVLQQRVVSSSELPQMLNDKETHHVSFSGAAKVLQKDEPKKFVSLSNMLMPRRDSDDGKGNSRLSRTPDDSQNVLLKQLLQNTACATSTPSPQTPSLPIVPSLEAQLARPVPPTPSSLIPPLLNEPPKPPAAVKDFPSSPQTPKPPSVPHTPTTPESSRAPSAASCLDELLSPPPQPPISSSLQGGPVIKREPMTSSVPPQGSTSPMTSPMEIKKEIVPVNVPVAVEVKKEVVSSDEMLSPGLRMEQEAPGDPSQDIKKQKRRIYQQKRRQSLGKESAGGTPKKRPRKSSKVEEDYDSFIDSLMLQLRQIPTTMTICEPNLTYNFTGSPVFGSGDLSKVNSCTRLGELRGSYGNAYLPHENDYYNTIPFGDLPPKAPSAPSTQRGFYNEEFAPLKLHATKDEFDDRKYDYNRDTNDTPDTIVSSSSPECIMPEFPTRYPGLQFIDSDSEDEKLKPLRFSPDIPIISPLVVRPKPIRFYSDMDKENEGPQGKKHCDNVTVTLTLNSQAADDVLSVLRNLANVLRIPVPVHYSITERMSKPSHRLGMCKIRSKDGKEGGQVDIQSILNGSTKFCRHCEVVITNNLMRKKASDLPLVAKQGEEELYFCSTACYMQLALAHPAPVHQEKAGSLVEHLGEVPLKKSKIDSVCDQPINKHDSRREKPSSTEVPPFMGTRGAGKRESRTSIDKAIAPPIKKAPSRYRVWTSMTIPPPSSRHKKPTEKEITEMMFKCGIPLTPPKLPDDTRTCLFCHQMGDGVTHGPARLLNYDVNKWVHLNCALWSDEVYETTSGGLVNVEQALQNGSSASCAYCNTTGATLKCYKIRCSVVYHLPCAVKDACVFYKNKTLYCASHVPKTEKENELTTLSVMRRVYIQRDEPRQIASIMHNTEQNNLLRVGSLTFLSVGQLLPHQLQNFHTPNYIYPIGYKILRMYWSMRVANRRCKYVCSIHESEGRPEFRIVIQERGEQDLELKDTTARGVWLKVLEPLAELRRNDTLVKMFSKYITGEDLFGLTEPVVVRVLESLPGIDTLTDYKFKYGKNPFLELPLAINPTGCARSEVRPKGPNVMRKAHTQRTSSVSYRPSQSPSISIPGEPLCPYSKQFVHSKSSQYKKMKQEWRNNVYLARSKIQGLGLYAARDLEKHTMVIEYIGEIIRTEVAETREKQYEAKNRGIYMFRLDEDRVVDATLSGGLARYINHSCYPNCVAETVEVDRDLRIIIFTKRRINRGEELAYDYKFDIEDDQHKIPCMCGAPNCRKWMN